MINCFENQKIKTSKLPHNWSNSLKELEEFLQLSWNQRSTFYDDGESYHGKQLFLDFDVHDGIKAQQYIGTIKFKGEQLNIFPKVFQIDEDDYDASELTTDELLRSLTIWIDYCDKSMFPFIANKSELYDTNNLKELMISIFTKYLKKTIEKQLFFQYEDITETGSQIKGKINFNDYIISKYPQGDKHKFEYTYSNFSFDNKLNRIIKYVCKLLVNDEDSRSNKHELRKIVMRLSDVSDENCSPYDCDQIHIDSMHKNYSTILSMSKMFLLNKISGSEFGLTDSYCFLFPADMLFEGFIAGFMKEKFGSFASIETQANDTHLAELIIDGEDYGSFANLREDILVKKDDTVFVLDTKYKPIGSIEKVKRDKSKLGVSINDIRQMAIYALKRNAKKLCLIYPLYREEEIEKSEMHLDIDPFEDGSKIFPCEIIKVPFIFDENIDNTKKVLKDILEKVL